MGYSSVSFDPTLVATNSDAASSAFAEANVASAAAVTAQSKASDASSAAAALPALVATFTNKRITLRVGTTASSATPTPAGDDVDLYTVTALAEAATFGAPTGTPTNGQKLMIRILDNGTARALAWNAIYVARGVTLPTTTVISKYLYVGFIYNSAASKWDCVASSQEA